MATAQAQQQYDADKIIDSNHEVTQKIIASFTKDGSVPTDKEGLMLLMEAIRISNAQALTVKRMATDKGIADKQAQAAGVIAMMLNDPKFRKISTTSISDAIPVLPDELPAPPLVAGELEINPAPIDYKSFTKK